MLIINNIKSMGMFQFMKEKKSFVEKFFIKFVSFNSKESRFKWKRLYQFRREEKRYCWREDIDKE